MSVLRLSQIDALYCSFGDGPKTNPRMLASNEERFTEERFTEEYDLSLDPLKAIRTPSRFDSGAGAGIKAIATAGGEDADFDIWFDSESCKQLEGI